MPDVFDRAQDRDAEVLRDAIADQQRAAAATPKLQPRGHCLNPACELEFSEPQRLFCNPSCEREHARRK